MILDDERLNICFNFKYHYYIVVICVLIILNEKKPNLFSLLNIIIDYAEATSHWREDKLARQWKISPVVWPKRSTCKRRPQRWRASCSNLLHASLWCVARLRQSQTKLRLSWTMAWSRDMLILLLLSKRYVYFSENYVWFIYRYR